MEKENEKKKPLCLISIVSLQEIPELIKNLKDCREKCPEINKKYINDQIEQLKKFLQEELKNKSEKIEKTMEQVEKAVNAMLPIKNKAEVVRISAIRPNINILIEELSDKIAEDKSEKEIGITVNKMIERIEKSDELIDEMGPIFKEALAQLSTAYETLITIRGRKVS